MDRDVWEPLLREQDGVVARRQVLADGGDDTFIESRLRRREWARVHPGVYVDHTGPPTWRQRSWAAVLYYWPAALSHRSALRAHGLTTSSRDADVEEIEVAIDAVRRQREVDGVRLHRTRGLASRVQANRSPPRVQVEHAVLDVASRAADEAAAVAVLADACQSRRTTARRLAAALETRPRLPRRRLLAGLVEDVASGAFSALEHRYLTRVERPHGLPTARRQRRVVQGRAPAYRDVEYRPFGLVVELDGRLGHELQAERWNDLDRDIRSLLSGDVTLRAGWRQVMASCRLADAVARVLRAKGWQGEARRCGPGCVVD